MADNLSILNSLFKERYGLLLEEMLYPYPLPIKAFVGSIIYEDLIAHYHKQPQLKYTGLSGILTNIGY